MSNVGNNKEKTITDKNNKTPYYLMTKSHFSLESPIDRSTLKSRNSLGLLLFPLDIPFIVTVEPPISYLYELHDHNTRQMTINNYNYHSVAGSHKWLQELAISDEVLISVHPRGSH